MADVDKYYEQKYSCQVTYVLLKVQLSTVVFNFKISHHFSEYIVSRESTHSKLFYKLKIIIIIITITIKLAQPAVKICS